MPSSSVMFCFILYSQYSTATGASLEDTSYYLNCLIAFTYVSKSRLPKFSSLSYIKIQERCVLIIAHPERNIELLEDVSGGSCSCVGSR
jgi:tyrosine-protein phosphatase YwqE